MVKLVHISNYYSVVPESNGHIYLKTGEKAWVAGIAIENGNIKQTWLQVCGGGGGVFELFLFTGSET